MSFAETFDRIFRDILRHPKDDSRPRLFKVFGIWECRGTSFSAWGLTPKEAFAEWQRLLSIRSNGGAK